MWNGKLKAVTFSFDDGVTQDERLIKLFNKYNVKGTFNLNSALLGTHGQVNINGIPVSHNKISPERVKDIYKGQEVAVHTLSHPLLPTLDEETIIWQVGRDRILLESLVGYPITGMAYPGGGTNSNEWVADIIKNKTGLSYARTIVSSGNFDLPENKMLLNPSVYYCDKDKLFSMGEQFINMKTKTPKMFYIWGHSYEMDGELIKWEEFEEFLKMISGKDDIFYGTNREILDKI